MGAGAVSCDVEAFVSYVWVVWEKNDGSIWLRRSTDYGATWGTPVAIDNGTYENHGPVVVVGSTSQQNVYVLWSGTRDGTGYFQAQISQSDNWGASFTRVYHSDGSSNKTSIEACRLPSSNTVIWVWEDDGSGAEEVS